MDLRFRVSVQPPPSSPSLSSPPFPPPPPFFPLLLPFNSLPSLYLASLCHLFSSQPFFRYSGIPFPFTHPYHLLYFDLSIFSFLCSLCISLSFTSTSSHLNSPLSLSSFLPLLTPS